MDIEKIVIHCEEEEKVIYQSEEEDKPPDIYLNDEKVEE